MNEQIARELELWRDRKGKAVIVSFWNGSHQGIVDSVSVDDASVIVRTGRHSRFEFQVADVEDAINWHGTILVRLCDLKDTAAYTNANGNS